ncbi:hypothetical protein ACFXGI_36935 [Streptomyces sp. NPDC059355]|uniref:hypothetical protein n=1 Tax=Streptomyces sp. NPDC059355 TaxID=3346811 RepID=UPI0036C8107F
MKHVIVARETIFGRAKIRRKFSAAFGVAAVAVSFSAFSPRAVALEPMGQPDPVLYTQKDVWSTDAKGIRIGYHVEAWRNDTPGQPKRKLVRISTIGSGFFGGEFFEDGKMSKDGPLDYSTVRPYSYRVSVTSGQTYREPEMKVRQFVPSTTERSVVDTQTTDIGGDLTVKDPSVSLSTSRETQQAYSDLRITVKNPSQYLAGIPQGENPLNGVQWNSDIEWINSANVSEKGGVAYLKKRDFLDAFRDVRSACRENVVGEGQFPETGSSYRPEHQVVFSMVDASKEGVNTFDLQADLVTKQASVRYIPVPFGVVPTQNGSRDVQASTSERKIFVDWSGGGARIS